MNILNLFKKVLGIAESPVIQNAVTSFNPIAGLVLQAAVQGILSAQQVLPASTPQTNAAKKNMVLNLLVTQAGALGEVLDEAQTSVLVEGILQAMKNAANTAPSKPLVIVPALTEALAPVASLIQAAPAVPARPSAVPGKV